MSQRDEDNEKELVESLKESIEEMNLMREGKLPKKSWREIMEEIRNDKEKE